MKEDSLSEKIEVSEELAQEYALAKKVSIEEAHDKLKENFKKEAESVDLKQQYHVLIKAFRSMSPQLNGVVMREMDVVNNVAALANKVSKLEYTVHTLHERLDFERDLFKKAMQLLNTRNQPLYARIWNRIKCLLKS